MNSSALIEKRRRQIVDAATLALSRSGFAKTGVKEIADHANVSIGLVYEYVRTKEDILFLVFEYWTNVWVSALREAVVAHDHPIDQLAAATESLVELSEGHRHVTHLFYHEAGHLTPEARERAKLGERELIEILSDVLRSGVKAGYVETDVNPTVVASNLLLLSHAWALKGYVLHQECSVQEYARWILNSMVRSCVTPKGLKQLERVLKA